MSTQNELDDQHHLWSRLASLSAALATSLSESEIAYAVLAHLRGAFAAEDAVLVAVVDKSERLIAASDRPEQPPRDWRVCVAKARAGALGFVGQAIRFDEREVGFLALAVAAPPSTAQVGFLGLVANLCSIALQRVRVLNDASTERTLLVAEEGRVFDLFMDAPANICVMRGEALRVVFANQAALTTMGATAIGVPIRDLFPALAAPEPAAVLARFFETGQAQRFEEIELVVDGHESRCYDLFVRPFFGSEGVDGLVAFATDISDVVRTRRAVEAMVIKARAADQRKDEFLAMLGHELRNPLGPARTALVLARSAIERGESANNFFQVAERQVNNLSRLVDDLLDVQRITRGTVVLRREHVDAGGAVGRALDALRPALEAKHRHLAFEVADQAATIFVDQVRLEQILSNLLSNALKFTAQEGCISVRVSSDRQAKEALIEMRDDGIGIAPEVLPRIFELFEQAERGLDRAQGGLGIGLTVVRSLSEQHGGHVEAHSDGLAKGATFVVHLPLVEETVSKIATTTPLAVQMNERRLLVVDDSADGAEMLALLLRSWGHEVSVARDGPAALQSIAAEKPEIVLLDIGLPGMDGYEVARRVRAAQVVGVKQPRLVALTGYGQETDRQEALAAGFDEHLVKPVDFARLREVIAAAP